MSDVGVIARTDRVLLRSRRVADADRFFDVYRRPEVTDWIGGRPMADRELEKLLAYRERMGWSFNWASSWESNFNFDFEHSRTRDRVSAMLGDEAPPIVSRFASECGTDPVGYLTEGPGLSVFALSDQDVYLTYSTTARGLEPVMTYYGILDRVPRGRDEGDPSDPTWVRRHDEFDQAAGAGASA